MDQAHRVRFPKDRRRHSPRASIDAGGDMQRRREDFRALIDKAKLMAGLPNIAPEMIQTYPGLAWVKEYHPAERSYTMLLLSEVYVRDLLGPKVIHYIGRTDWDFWPPEIASLFYAGDEAARLNGDAWVEENFSSPLTGKTGVFTGAKWSFTSNGGLFVAGAGRGAFTT
jgi:hypothetical protein